MLQAAQAALHTQVAAALAAAAVAAAPALPPKLNLLVQPLMAAVRRETLAPLQDGAASALGSLTLRCAARTPCPNDK